MKAIFELLDNRIHSNHKQFSLTNNKMFVFINFVQNNYML